MQYNGIQFPVESVNVVVVVAVVVWYVEKRRIYWKFSKALKLLKENIVGDQ